MKDRKFNISFLFPLFVSGALAFGFYLGKKSGPMSIEEEENRESLMKLHAILDYVENNYVEEVSRQEITEEAIQKLLQELDPHSIYIPPVLAKQDEERLSGGYEGVGIRFLILKDTLTVVQATPNGPSDKQEILPGDKIISVNGESIVGIGIKNEDVLKLLKGPANTTVDIEIYRDGYENLIPKTIVRSKVDINSVLSYMINETTGYIKIESFTQKTSKEFSNAARLLKRSGAKNIILDLRNNGGGYLNEATRVVDDFLMSGLEIVSTRGKNRELKNYYSTAYGNLEDLEVSVLINQNSASASEIIAGAIQDQDRGFIVGRRSFGKGLVQETYEYKDGSLLRLTIARYYTPSGRCIQKSYEEGIEDYVYESYDRYESGELFEIDSSVFVDSLKYSTAGGRIVYGGGGIMPDYFVPYDTVGITPYYTRLRYAGILYEYAFLYSLDHKDELLSKYGDWRAMNDDFAMTEDVFNQIAKYAQLKDNITITGELSQYQKEKIFQDFKAKLAFHLWGQEAEQAVENTTNKDVLKALEVLNQ